MLRKLMTLALAVTAFVALAAPSMASADFWYTGDERVGDVENKDSVHFTGTLSSTKGPVKISCNATANVAVWNEEATGTGEVENLLLSEDPVTDPPTGGCTVAINLGGGYADIAGCHVIKATSEEFPWHVNVQANTVIDIVNANFTNKFFGCQPTLGIPNNTEIKSSGTVTGQAVNRETLNGDTDLCIVFSESGHIPQTKIDGELCSTYPLHLTGE